MAREWKNFWNHLDESGDVCTGAAELMQSHWDAELRPLLANTRDVAIADLACGSGVVGRSARAIAEESGGSAKLTFVDVAAAALEKVRSLAGEHGDTFIEASLLDLSLAPSSQDIVVSQFGLEYAGLEAFSVAAELVRPGGHLIVMSHVKNGAVWDECASDRLALNAVLEPDVLERVERLVDETDTDRRMAGEQALADQLGNIQRQIEGQNGGGVDYVQKLLPDLLRLYVRRAAYDRIQITSWLTAQREKVTSFRDRMVSMVDAALSEEDIKAVFGRLDGAGLSNKSCKLQSGLSGDRPMAWLIKAENNR